MEILRDCFVLIIAHGTIDTINPDYVSMPEGSNITTILPTNIGIDCFVDMLHLKISVVRSMSREFFHASPLALLDAINRILKSPDKGTVLEKDRADFCSFLGCAGDFSKKDTEYYNKKWILEKRLGSVLLFTRNGDYVEELYEGRFGELTKKELIDLLTGRGFKTILIMDTSCSSTMGTKETIQTFETYGAYGGKKCKKTRIKRRKGVVS